MRRTRSIERSWWPAASASRVKYPDRRSFLFPCGGLGMKEPLIAGRYSAALGGLSRALDLTPPMSSWLVGAPCFT